MTRPRLFSRLSAARLDRLPAGSWHRFLLQYDTAPTGEPLVVPVAVLRGSRAGPSLTVVAGVHGDEFEGIRALWHLLQRPDFRIDAGRLTVVPIAHPAAYTGASRRSPLDGVNLARVFPGNRHGTTSERLAYTLFEALVRRSDALVDLHSGGVQYLHRPLAGFYDVDTRIGRASLALARATGWDLLWAAPRRAGVLSYEAVRHGVAALGTEVGGAGRCLAADVARYAPTLQRLLRHVGLLRRRGEIDDGEHQTMIDGDWLLVPAAGFLETTVELDQRVRAGQVLGRVLDHFGTPRAELRAERPGIVVGIRAYPPVMAGEWGIFVGRVRSKEGT